ncbi:MAG: BMC domain-containing protein [Acidimicrobiales bacterium]|nr:BMC domain-containing protein [Acidimicrobiales bacterium]
MPTHPAGAVGVLEVLGRSFAISALDAMLKTAPVELLSQQIVGGGLVSVAITGDIASVRSALDEGVRVVSQLGSTAVITVLGRPEPETLELLPSSQSRSSPSPAKQPAKRPAKQPAKQPAKRASTRSAEKPASRSRRTPPTT